MPMFYPPSGLDVKMKGNAGGANNDKMVIWSKILVPTVAMGYAIDYTEAGFTAVTNVSVIAQRSTTNPFDVPNVSINGDPTATGMTVNITQGSNNLVSVLGLSVLGGPAVIAATPISSIKLYVRVEGY